MKLDTGEQAKMQGMQTHEPAWFDWATKVNVSGSLSPVTPDSFIPTAFAKHSLIAPAATTVTDTSFATSLFCL